MNLPFVVSAKELNDASSQQVVIVDLRSADDYTAGHIPNAVHLPTSTLVRSENGANGLLPDQAGIHSVVSQIGLRSGDHVVAYDQGATTAAARLIWVLHAYGFTSVSWLNGGFDAWQRAQLPLSTQAAEPMPSDMQLTFTPGNMLSVEQLMEQLNDENLRVVDVRSAGEYDGSDVRSKRGGRIPKAHHVEWTNVFNEDGELKDDETLRSLFTAYDIGPQNHVSVYCQTHQRSAVTYMVLKHLQYEQVTALDGAWSNWGNRTDTPIENETSDTA